MRRTSACVALALCSGFCVWRCLWSSAYAADPASRATSDGTAWWARTP